ncbi:DASH family cryptochrome [uncultured Psychrobacter sp.]|uniref:DASH family cryptochrome n=1 Tax=uncultured Psychrobacter sp. TaxID=259303 RepID=UPI0026126122|nr:DASH family cryptochrome [uncultured Psychrobacter sp.]
MTNEQNKNVVMVLFHNDLRIHDNATLSKAAEQAKSGNLKSGYLLPVYAVDLTEALNQEAWGQAYHFDKLGHARQQFINESLIDLDRSLQSLGSRLLYLRQVDKESSANTFNQLCQLIEQQQVSDIFVSDSADYAQLNVYNLLRAKYANIAWHSESINTLYPIMPTKELPQSFTQFRKKVEYAQDLLKAETNLEITETPRSLSPLPAALINESKYALQLPSVDKPNPNDEKDKPKYQGGESAALNHLKSYFASNAPSSYKTTRNALDEWTHSTKFSAWLANGTLSVKVLLNRLRQYEREVVANGSTYWIWFELLWREYFYWYAIEHQEDLFLFKGIGDYRPSMRHDDQRLAQWQNGETKYPIINACMRQLNHTGYMSNRGRQLVASCFIHELDLDWRYGAAYFEQQLIDYDVGSNWGNWQYLAGVGADPRGSRQFNLKKQTQQHDPNGKFMDKWLS